MISKTASGASLPGSVPRERHDWFAIFPKRSRSHFVMDSSVFTLGLKPLV